jgi:hypothetical protein
VEFYPFGLFVKDLKMAAILPCTIVRETYIPSMAHPHPLHTLCPPLLIYGIIGLATPNKQTTLSSLLQEFNIPSSPLMIHLFVMPVNAANMFDYHLEPPQLLALFLLNFNIVIGGYVL